MLKKENTQKYIFIITLVVMFGLPLIKLIGYAFNFLGLVDDPFKVNHVYILWFSIPLYLGTYIYGLSKKYFNFNYDDLIVIILAFLGFISTFLAKDIQISIFGEYHRNEGLLTLLSYYLIYLNIKNLSREVDKHKLIDIFIYIGLFQVLYGILQVYTNLPFIKDYPNMPYMAMGLCSNPNFYGSYMTILTLITISLYLLNNKTKYLVYSILFFIGLCLASSTGPMIGFILAFIFLLIYYFKILNIKKIIYMILILISSFFIIDYSINSISNKVHNVEIDKNYNIKEEVTEIITNNNNVSNEQFGNGRIALWKNLLPYAYEYWPFGVGIDNIKVIYPKDEWLRYDKAHNVYLQILITNGALALILYCLLSLIIFIKGFKIKDSFYISLFIAFIGYSIQAFANISVIEVTPYFFIILGLLSSYEESREVKE